MRREAEMLMALFCFVGCVLLALLALWCVPQARASDRLPTHEQLLAMSRWQVRQLERADRLLVDHSLAVATWRAQRPVAVEEGRIP